MGYGMIILLAGLQGIPDSLYDSADIDGASQVRKFLHITFPLLSPISFFVIVLSVINGFETELRQRIVGFNTHVLVFALGWILIGIDAIRRDKSMLATGPAAA